MKKEAAEKTNVMRVLEQSGAEYSSKCYIDTDAVSALDVATVLNEDPDRMFKTLVTIAPSKHNYVFMVPAPAELDLKKAAKVAGEKSIEMIKSKELLPLTGYIHGGCSPIGMKKQFPTFIDETVILYDSIIFSGGKIGYMVDCKLSDLQRIIPVSIADITV